MFLKTSSEYEELVAASERCLKELPLVFQKNGTDRVSEFEIVHPVYFRILIEPNKVPKTRNLLMPSISPPVGSTIEITYGLESDPEDQIKASESARVFLRSLTKAMPEPWRGLSGGESAKEEKRWKEQLR